MQSGETLRKRLEQDLNQNSNATIQKQHLELKLVEMHANATSRIKALENKVNSLTQENAKILSQTGNSADAIRVKDSMLDDQNNTIKTLKLNLENKVLKYLISD